MFTKFIVHTQFKYERISAGGELDIIYSDFSKLFARTYHLGLLHISSLHLVLLAT